MFLNESARKWSNIITEELGVQDKGKLAWMSNYASFHEIYEGLQSEPTADAGIYSTPLNTLGIGNPGFPIGVGYNATSGAGIGNTAGDFHNPGYKVGSGDSIPMSTLPIALNVAAMTIALELVPVIQSNGPWYMLSYMDFPYAGGKLARFNETSMDGKGVGAHNKPIYIKVSGDRTAIRDIKSHVKKGDIRRYDDVAFVADDAAAVVGKFMGFSRIDNDIMVQVVKVVPSLQGEDSGNLSIANVFDGDKEAPTKVEFGKVIVSEEGVSSLGENKSNLSANGAVVRPDFVATMTDHLPEFVNFFGADGQGAPTRENMTRAQNETGVGNTIGARMFSKLVQMGNEEVTGSVTRMQLRDMPLYGIDVIGKVLEAMQNELSQKINTDILDRLFRLGVTNALQIMDAQGANLNLYVSAQAGGEATIPAGIMLGIDEAVDASGRVAPVDHSADFGKIKNAHVEGAAENITTFQRRIMSRVLAASNLIAQVGRRGRANWVVTNTHIMSALQDAANFVVAPMANSLTQDGSQSLYFAGSLAGLNLYVDPNMEWSDTRVLVGKKGDGNCPGVIFMPYVLADSVQITAEGTMAPKLLLNSSYAVVDAGFHPETAYYCFYVCADDDILV